MMKSYFRLIILVLAAALVLQPVFVAAQGTQAPHTQGLQQNQNTWIQMVKDILAKLKAFVKNAGVNIGALLKRLKIKLADILKNLDKYIKKVGEFLKKLFTQFAELAAKMKKIIWGFLAGMFEKVLAIFNRETKLP